jgi:hypothetical protein
MTSWHDDLKPEAAYFTANEFGERCGSGIKQAVKKYGKTSNA